MRISNLYKNYGNQVVLDGISVEAGKGQIIGLVGNNGSGKSTLLKCISNLIKDFKGEITLDSPVSFSIESPSFYDDLSVEMNLKLFSILASADELKYQEVLKIVKLDKDKKKKFSQLSLGMKQKLSIARMLLSDNDIILLDEPFNGLDILTKEQLKELILMFRTEGKLIIVSSHILEDLGEICDVIWYLSNGKIKNVVNLQGEIRKYNIVLSETSSIPENIMKKYAITLNSRNEFFSIFEGNFAKNEVSNVLQELVLQGVKVIEFKDITNDIRNLMI